MELYSENKEYKLYNGSMLDMLEVIEPNSIDSIITDPPYELNFMNKGWDNSGIAFQKETWEKCLKVLKPGGYLLAFGGSRTFHRIACAIEDAGFEIRDTIMWLYGSGMPKGLNIGLAIDKRNGVDNRTGIIKTDGKGTNSGSSCYNCNDGKDNSMKKEYLERVAQNEWSGYNTQLKPAYEPIIVAQKPVEKSIIDNVLKYGVGGINIDECRVGTDKHTVNINDFTNYHGNKFGNGEPIAKLGEKEITGRFPANVILTYDDTNFEEVCGGMPDTKSTFNPDSRQETEIHRHSKDFMQWGYKERITNENNSYNDEGSASRYFYCAKASKFDRDEGLDDFEEKEFKSALNTKNGTGERLDGGKTPIRKNTHTTVKPTQLMQYLVRLVSPKGATILDCFNGSGSTGKAVMLENKKRNANYKYIGIELTDEYLPISKARIEYVINNDFDFWKDENNRTQHEKVNKDIGQTTLFDFLGGRA